MLNLIEESMDSVLFMVKYSLSSQKTLRILLLVCSLDGLDEILDRKYQKSKRYFKKGWMFKIRISKLPA